MFFENSVGLVGNTVGEVPSSSVGEVKFFYILPEHLISCHHIILQLEYHLQNGNLTRTPKQIKLITFCHKLMRVYLF